MLLESKRTWSTVLEDRSQIRSALSPDPETTRPSEKAANALTSCELSLGPRRGPRGSTSQIRRVLSEEADTRRSLGRVATAVIAAVCPSRIWRTSPEQRSQTL